MTGQTRMNTPMNTNKVRTILKPREESKLEPQQNHLLAALSPEVQGRLFPHLELVPLKLRALLYDVGRPMRHVYFPTDSIISLQYMMEDGASTAILVVGNEGLIGITLFMGGETTRGRSVVQSAGHAFRLPRARVKDEFGRHGELLQLMLRYTQALITQVAQTAVCNRHHSIDQQLCRWLLLSMDRLSHNHLTMTQEFIAGMLGVRREGVTAAAIKLRDAGVISYARGLIKVLDRQKLEQAACECYAVVHSETERLLPYLPQRQLVTRPADIPVVENKVIHAKAWARPRRYPRRNAAPAPTSDGAGPLQQGRRLISASWVHR